MRIVVLNPPSIDKFYINRDQMGGMGQKISFGGGLKTRVLSSLKSQFIHLPVMQLAYIATLLNKENKVKVIDALNLDWDVDKTVNEVAKFNPEKVFMATSSSEILFERDVVANAIKGNVGCDIITVGDTLPNLPFLLTKPFDAAIIGEAEKPVLEVCQGKPYEKIDGLMIRKGKMVIKNEKRVMLSPKELDGLPFPDWSLFPYQKFAYFPLILKRPVAPILSSRGCPYGCYYCSYTKNMGGGWRARSAENVVGEIINDQAEYGFRGVVFRDPLFSFNKKRTEDICSGIVRNKLDVSWVFETRPELLDNKLLEKLKKAGCSGINLGVEDINPDVLKKSGRKPVSIKKIKEIVHYAEALGIRTTCFFILGLPGSTKKSISELINFSISLNPSHAEYKVATPYPGTILYKLAKRNKWIKTEDFTKLGGYSSIMQVSKELTPNYLEQESQEAFKKFYLNSDYIIRELKRGSAFSKGYCLLRYSLASLKVSCGL